MNEKKDVGALWGLEGAAREIVEAAASEGLPWILKRDGKGVVRGVCGQALCRQWGRGSVAAATELAEQLWTTGGRYSFCRYQRRVAELAGRLGIPRDDDREVVSMAFGYALGVIMERKNVVHG